ncbi:MAG: acyl-CoA thioesterase [Gammaproteobacteria bacterium]
MYEGQSSGTKTDAARLASSYRFWVPEHVRFADLDLIGHVNNKAYTTYAESARVVFLQDRRLWVPGELRTNVIARLEIDYLSELHFPAELRIGVRVLKIGRSSFTLGLGIFAGETCSATAVTVLVRVDASTRKAVELTAEERARLEPYLA